MQPQSRYTLIIIEANTQRGKPYTLNRINRSTIQYWLAGLLKVIIGCDQGAGPIYGWAGLRDWKSSHSLSERLTSLGIIGAQLKTPIKPFNTIVQGYIVQGCPQLVPHDAEMGELLLFHLSGRSLEVFVMCYLSAAEKGPSWTSTEIVSSEWWATRVLFWAWKGGCVFFLGRERSLFFFWGLNAACFSGQRTLRVFLGRERCVFFFGHETQSVFGYERCVFFFGHETQSDFGHERCVFLAWKHIICSGNL